MKSKFKFSLLMMLLAFMSFAAPPPFPQYDIDDNIEIVVSSDYRYLTCEAVSPIVKSPNQEINYNQVYSVSYVSMVDRTFYLHKQCYHSADRVNYNINNNSPKSIHKPARLHIDPGRC